MPAPRTLSTADERREEILVAASRVFAARGLHGTPTIAIAKAAGISQAYLFRLFPTKSELFIALVQRCNERIYATFAAAAVTARAAGEPVMKAMGHAYLGLLEDRDLLLNQLHAHAACDDPEICAVMRDGFARLFELVERESGAGTWRCAASSPTGCCSTCSPRCTRRTSTRAGPRPCCSPNADTRGLRRAFLCLRMSD